MTKTIYISGVRVQINQFGFKIFTRDQSVLKNVIKYIRAEGIKFN